MASVFVFYSVGYCKMLVAVKSQTTHHKSLT